MTVYVSRFQALASYAASLGPDGLRQVVADQLGTLIALATGRAVTIAAPDVRFVEVTAAAPPTGAGDRPDPVVVFHVEVSCP